MSDFTIKATREDIKKFNKWRKRASKRLPELSARVFALRNVAYMGCGFHWSMEKELGYCIQNVTNYDRRYVDVMEHMNLEIVFADLFKRIKKIENSLVVIN